MGTVPVAGKAAGNIKPSLTTGDDEKHSGSCQAAKNLSDNIRYELTGRKPPARHQPKRNGWVQVASRDMANGESHRKNSETERQRHANKPNSQIWKSGSKNSSAATSKNQPKRAYEFGD